MLAASCAAGPAFADPCEAPVSGFRAGQTFAGTVRHIGDGDSLCVGPGGDPRTWVEVRLADFSAPELSEPNGRAARDTLRRLTAGRRAICTAVRGRNGRTRSYDRVIATCTVGGVSLARQLRQAGVREGGR